MASINSLSELKGDSETLYVKENRKLDLKSLLARAAKKEKENLIT